jgi:hypothetical protein
MSIVFGFIFLGSLLSPVRYEVLTNLAIKDYVSNSENIPDEDIPYEVKLFRRNNLKIL